MGGLMALYTAIRFPEIFGKVISQSGAFCLPDLEFVLTDLIRYFPKKEVNIWMDAGRFETLHKSNRAMKTLLDGKGYPVKYQEFSGGHNTTSWRDHISRGLEYLFNDE